MLALCCFLHSKIGYKLCSSLMGQIEWGKKQIEYWANWKDMACFLFNSPWIAHFSINETSLNLRWTQPLMNPTFDEPNLRWTQPSMNPTFDEPNLWWTQPSMNQTFDDSNLRWTKPSMNPCGPLINFWIQMFLFYIILRVVFVILCLPLTIYTSESDVFVSGKNCLLFGGPQWCPPVFATICADDRFAQVLLLTPVQKELKFWKTDNLYCPCFVVKERMMMQSNWNSVETFFLLLYPIIGISALV